jgi:hypothetical protein
VGLIVDFLVDSPNGNVPSALSQFVKKCSLICDLNLLYEAPLPELVDLRSAASSIQGRGSPLGSGAWRPGLLLLDRVIFLLRPW